MSFPYGENGKFVDHRWTYAQFDEFCKNAGYCTPSHGSPFYGIRCAFGGPMSDTDYSLLCSAVSTNTAIARGYFDAGSKYPKCGRV